MRRLAAHLLALLAIASSSSAEVRLELVVTGFSQPVSIANAGDARLFVAQQSGLVRVFDGTRIFDDPFLDLRSLVSTGGERGLLGLAFPPDYASSGFFFVDYTNTAGDTVIARYSTSPTNPSRADPSSATQVLLIPQPFANHNGGQLQFGSDGFLYIGMGDGGSGGDPGNRAQNPDLLLGKLLRIDVRSLPYSIPPSNPFASGDARPEIWASGLRNPWRFSFDRETGDLWLADVGQGDWEEIDFQTATSIGGENYGWRIMEGTHCFDPPSGCNSNGLVLPVIEYDHSAGDCAVTGGYVYRGTQSPQLRGTYVYGDFCSGRIHGARRDAAGIVTSRPLLDTNLRISTFGEDANGEIYVADYAAGTLYRIVDDAPGGRRRAVRH